MNTVKVGIVLAFVVVLTQGCATAPEADSAAVSDELEAVAQYVPQQGLSDQQRFREVLNLLEDGEPKSARAELIIYLEAHPRSEVAQDLLAQIDTSALEYFPEDYREIQLASGQSLSTVSKAYLGNLYQFHALAKYNGIDEPRSIKIGQTIRIPLTDAAVATFAGVGSETPAELEIQAEPDVVVQSAPASPAQLNEEQIIDRVDGLHKQALDAFRAQDLDKAIALWDEVLLIDPQFENVALHRSQAIELKNKLSNLH